jgi:predicted AAA+ superfamily ATPase
MKFAQQTLQSHGFFHICLTDYLKSAVTLSTARSYLGLSALANPQKLETLIPTNFTDRVVIDEIQKIPTLLNEVHRLIKHKKLDFYLQAQAHTSLNRRG